MSKLYIALSYGDGNQWNTSIVAVTEDKQKARDLVEKACGDPIGPGKPWHWQGDDLMYYDGDDSAYSIHTVDIAADGSIVNDASSMDEEEEEDWVSRSALAPKTTDRKRIQTAIEFLDNNCFSWDVDDDVPHFGGQFLLRVEHNKLVEVGYEEENTETRLESVLGKFLLFVDNGSEPDIVVYDVRPDNIVELYRRWQGCDQEDVECYVFEEKNLDTGEILSYEPGHTTTWESREQ